MDRTETSRRLKAARMLAGGVDKKGRPVAITTRELAEHPLLVDYDITRNRLEEIEQMKVTPGEGILQRIAEALGVSLDWFAEGSERDPSRTLAEVERLMRQLGQVAQGLRQAQAATPPGPAETDRPPPGGEGGGR